MITFRALQPGTKQCFITVDGVRVGTIRASWSKTGTPNGWFITANGAVIPETYPSLTAAKSAAKALLSKGNA